MAKCGWVWLNPTYTNPRDTKQLVGEFCHWVKRKTVLKIDPCSNITQVSPQDSVSDCYPPRCMVRYGPRCRRRWYIPFCYHGPWLVGYYFALHPSNSWGHIKGGDGDRIYDMRCLFVAVGPYALFIVLPHVIGQHDTPPSHSILTLGRPVMFHGSNFRLNARQAVATPTFLSLVTSP